MRAALYARISTSDQQTLPMQLEEMRSYAMNRGWQIVNQISDIGSGVIPLIVNAVHRWFNQLAKNKKSIQIILHQEGSKILNRIGIGIGLTTNLE